MEHGRRHETLQKKDLKRPVTRSSPTTTHSARMARMARGYNSSAQSPFRRRTEHSLWKTPSNLGARGTLPFGSKSRQRTGTKKQISLAEWKQVEKMKILKQIAEEKDMTKNPIHRVSSPAFEKPATSGSLTSRTFPSNKKDKALTQDQSQTEKIRPVGHPSLVSPAMAKSRAIEEKRKEIEKVYQRDCGTFSRVVKQLVSKDPSLVPPIRFAVQENLKEIGLRCAAAMDQFITQYDLSAASQEMQTHTHT
ncbi:periphilin-1-like isoform X2 [Gadus chalcogrammus]|uniref:periphilin-1-like isoform X2 n=1 Tax=Gadus chalcogrammus TaxID=1042646 RepID=UPI0024C4300D|nr:periphilin-1-like isoform X2 [Gadus chalcogrammus]